MAEKKNKTGNASARPTPAAKDSRRTEPDPHAPAGSPNSLGEESVRDGRPATDDSIVEAIDEEDLDTGR